MVLGVKAAIGLRWRTHDSGSSGDVARVIARGESHLSLLANGFECGFSACWPPASRRMLDIFCDEWLALHDASQNRLEIAFERSRQRFVHDARSLLGDDPEFPDDSPAAVLLAVELDGDHARAAWIGGDIAVLTRAGSVVATTTPHTLREEYLRRNEAPELVAQLPNVLSRSIQFGDSTPPSTLSFRICAGDTLVLLSRAVFHGPCVAPERVALEAGARADPDELAERLAELGSGATDTPYSAVIVLAMREA